MAEGGGQRGIYTAGVLDAFMARTFNPFDLAVGVSAGSQNLLAYTLQQPGYAKRAIMELTNRPDFLVFHRCLMAGSVIDLDGYFQTILNDPDFLLPCHNLATVAKNKRLHVVATDSSSLEPVYLVAGPSTALRYLKASSAVPFLYRSGVAVNGHMLVDGGVADPLPIQHAYEQGARRIVLVCNEPFPVSQNRGFKWRHLLSYTRRMPIKSPRLVAMWERYDEAMQAVNSFINNPPDDLQLHVIAPSVPMKCKVFSNQPEQLAAVYDQGFADGIQAVNQLKSWSDTRGNAMRPAGACA